MTEKRLKFCTHYIELQSATASARLAGFSESYSLKQSHLLLKIPEIQEKIKHLEEEYFSKEFKKLAYKSIKKLDNIISSGECDNVQLSAVKYALSQANVSDKEDSEAQTVHIKIKMPIEL